MTTKTNKRAETSKRDEQTITRAAAVAALFVAACEDGADPTEDKEITDEMAAVLRRIARSPRLSERTGWDAEEIMRWADIADGSTDPRCGIGAEPDPDEGEMAEAADLLAMIGTGGRVTDSEGWFAGLTKDGKPITTKSEADIAADVIGGFSVTDAEDADAGCWLVTIPGSWAHALAERGDLTRSREGYEISITTP